MRGFVIFLKNIFNKLINVYKLIVDTRRSLNPLSSKKIFNQLDIKIKEIRPEEETLEEYFNTRNFIGEYKVTKDWEYYDSLNEWQLSYSSNIFADSTIRLFLPGDCKRVVVFFPGSITSANTVITNNNSNFSLREYCEENNLGLAVWDWPLQGERLSEALYEELGGYVFAEREYSRILGLFGTSIWAEYIKEAEFCLGQLHKLNANKVEFDVAGWSQGAYFAYFSPFLGYPIRKVISAGSCASISDLISSGKSYVHGYFYYPDNYSPLLDIKSVTQNIIDKKINLSIISGEKDRGCLRTTIEDLKKIFREEDSIAKLLVTKNEGHFFAGEIKKAFLQEIS